MTSSSPKIYLGELNHTPLGIFASPPQLWLLAVEWADFLGCIHYSA